MTQRITVTRVDDHWTMEFEGNDTEYPVPESAIDKLDDDLTPEEEGESVTFVGDYGGHKHMKNFDVEEVVDAPGDDTDDGSDEDDGSRAAEPTPEHVEEAGYHNAAGQAQQHEARRALHGGEED